MNFSKYFLVLVTLSAMAMPGYAAKARIKTVHSGTAHEAFFDIDFDGSKGFAVGAGGSIFASSDGGESWAPEQGVNRLALLGITVKGDRAIAVGQMGAILVRQGDGSWQQVESGTTERLFKVDMNSSGLAVAVGSFGTLLRSEDHGQTWAKAAPAWEGVFEDPEMRLGGFFEPSLYGVQVNEDGHVWACGELSLVMSSLDAGVTWSFDNAGGSTVDGVSPTLSDITIRNDGVGFAVGQEGFVLRTQDMGQSWAALKLNTKSNLLGVSSRDDGLVVITGMRHMRMSFNNGDQWFSIRGSDISSGWYSGVALPAQSSSPIVVGHQSRMLQLSFNK